MSQRRSQLGFLDFDYYYPYESGGGDWADYSFTPDYGWDWGWYDTGGGGDDYWSNFNAEGDWVGPSGPGYTYSDYFDPITGDWIESGSTLETFSTSEPYALPPAPTMNWWDYLNPWYTPPILPDYTPPIGWDETPPAPSGPALPGYCPQGTYHPTWDPFACVPFPPQQTQTAPRSAPAPRQSPQRPPTPSGGGSTSQQKPPQCPPGYVMNPQTQKCVKAPQCPQGTVLNPQTGQCVKPPQCPQGLKFNPQSGRCEKATSFFNTVSGLPWWVWLLVAGIGAVALSDNSGGSRGRRRR